MSRFPSQSTPLNAFAAALALVLAAPPALAEKEKPARPAEETPPLVWGYGNRTCAEYLLVYPDPKQPVRAELAAEYLHMREWVGGFATGLSLATGTDMLRGGNMEEVMERLRTHCATHMGGDLFNATMGVFHALSTESFDPKPKP